MADENSRSKKSELTDKLIGLAALTIIPGMGVITGVAVRKELEHPFDSLALMGLMEYAKFNAYAYCLGKLSAYFF